MYTDEQIMEMFKGKYNDTDSLYKGYFYAYVNIYKQSFFHPCESDKYNFHHFYCSFLYKQQINTKNRYHTIEKLDEFYKPNDNVCKLRILYHVLAHYYLAMSMCGTIYEFDASNAFYTLVGNFDKALKDYTIDEVKELGRLIEENAPPNSINHYITMSERKDLYKQTAKEIKQKYEQDNKEEIEKKKKDLKQKQKENREKWKEEHKEEIEERKIKQREYMKKMREEFKKNAKNKN